MTYTNCPHIDGTFYEGTTALTIHDLLASGVVRVYAAECAFAAVKCDGSLVTWLGSQTKCHAQLSLELGFLWIFDCL